MKNEPIQIGDIVAVDFDPDPVYYGLVVNITEEGEKVTSYVTGEYADYYDYSILFHGSSEPTSIYRHEIVEIVSKVAL